MKTKAIAKQLNAKGKRKKPIPDEAWLSTGNTLLNLALSGRIDGGLAMGKYLWIVGDSSSGKTWYGLQILAEAARNPHWKKHRLIYDDLERGALMDMAKYFGAKLLDRLEPLGGTKADPEPSVTVQQFYKRVYKSIKAGPCLIVLDSMDALDEKQDIAKFEKESEAADDEKSKGDYGMRKAKYNSDNIKRLISLLDKHGSSMVILNQTRDNVNAGLFAPKKRAGSGGWALKFYAHGQIWTSIRGSLTRTVLGKKREYGKLIQIEIEKNRFSGWEGKVVIPFMRQHGFDEVGGCIDYLCDEGYWKRNDKGIIIAPEFKFEGRREDLVQKIEKKELRLDKVRNLTQFLWWKIDEAVRVKRKSRYE